MNRILIMSFWLLSGLILVFGPNPVLFKRAFGCVDFFFAGAWAVFVAAHYLSTKKGGDR